jgi:GH15 family glucan-1,4-alpha-glucosidase
MVGRLADAEALFERLLAVRNDLGLLAEEYHPELHRQLGDFPQAFSHVGIIDSAFRLLAKRQGRWQSFPAAMADAAA